MEKKYLSRDKIIGKEVIDSNATIIGSVKDIVLDLGSKNVAITILAKTGVDITVEGDKIAVVGDVVLLNKPVELPLTPQVEKVPTPERPQATPQPAAAPPTTPGLCSNCGYQNDANSKFCIKCGSRLK